jgi:hypothetical protein
MVSKTNYLLYCGGVKFSKLRTRQQEWAVGFGANVDGGRVSAAL